MGEEEDLEVVDAVVEAEASEEEEVVVDVDSEVGIFSPFSCSDSF